MMRTLRPLVAVCALATMLSVSASLPVLAQSGNAESITHRQSVRTEMSASGDILTSRVFTQLTIQGEGQVQVALPNQATEGLRNLDAFGRPSTDGDQVTYTVNAHPDGVSERTVATNTADLPIELEVAYRLDGAPIEPKDLVGKDGQLEVSFTARNTTAVPTEIEIRDGRNARQNETIDVAVPFVGSISLELDQRFVAIDAPGASVAGNGRGATFVSWSMVLFEPIGAEEQTVTYTAHVTDAIVPSVVAQFLPVDSNSFGSLGSVQDTFGGVADGLREITSGGIQINANVQALAIGAGQVLGGVGRLSNGADKLAAGLNDTAVPGAVQLADGAGQASAGANQLADGLGDLQVGAGDLSVGLGQARTGGAALADGLGQLAAGSSQLVSGADRLSDGASQLDSSTGELSAGASQVNAGAEGLLGGLTTLKQALNAPTGTAKLIAGVDQLNDGAKNLIAGIGDQQTAGTLQNGAFRLQLGADNPEMIGGSPGLKQGLDGLLNGLNTQVRPGVQGLVAALDTGAPVPGVGVTSVRILLEDTLSDRIDELGDQLPPGDPTKDAQVLQLGVALAMLGATTDFTPGGSPPATVLGGLAQLEAAVQVAPATCADAREMFAFVSGLGLTPPLTVVVKVLSCGAADLGAGAVALQGGISNPGALALNPTCAPTTDPAKACGVRQGMQLISGGLDNPAAEQAGASFNPTCLAPGDPGYKAGMAPCGLKQGLQLSLATINAGLGSPTDDPAKNPTLLGGASALADGSKLVADGAARLKKEGTAPLAAGAGELAAGANQLSSGAGQAAAGAGDLRSGLVQLDDGGKQLAAGAERARSGASDLADGLVRLDDGTTQLADGLVGAGEGAETLAEGLDTVEDAMAQIASGSERLSTEGLSVLIAGASDATVIPRVAVEQARLADARGQAGEGLPYGTAEGSVASAVYQFELAGHGGDSGPSMPVRGIATVLALVLAGGLAFIPRRGFI